MTNGRYRGGVVSDERAIVLGAFAVVLVTKQGERIVKKYDLEWQANRRAEQMAANGKRVFVRPE